MIIKAVGCSFCGKGARTKDIVHCLVAVSSLWITKQ